MVRQSRPHPAQPRVVILTRPMAQSARFAAELAQRLPELHPILSPLTLTEFLPFAPPCQPSALILTSATAVEALRRNPVALPDIAYCVGRRTAAAAVELGVRAVSADGDAEALLALILARNPAPPLWHLHGEETRGNLAERLNSAGIETVSNVAYRQIPQALTPEARAALAGDAPVLLPVFSPRSAALLVAELRCLSVRAPLHFAAISTEAAAPLRDFPHKRLAIAATPDASAMLEAMVRLEQGGARD